MAVTAQQIADLAGVSRGTVDRALHNRGRVNPEVKEKIQKIALELGYKPNLIGQALVRSKQDFKLGVILQSTETPTMQIVRAAGSGGACSLRRRARSSRFSGSGHRADARIYRGAGLGRRAGYRAFPGYRAGGAAVH